MPDPKRATAFTFDVALVDSAARPAFKANPTLAAGDVKLSQDGGAFANLATLPVVEPAGGRNVKVALSASEMTADRVVVQFVDAAGAEWDELLVTILPTVQTVDDVASQASVNTVDDFLDTEVAAIKAKTDQLTFTNANKVDAAILAAGDFAQAAADKVWSAATRTLSAFSFAVDLSAAAVTAIWDKATSALTTVGSIGKLLVDNVNATISSRASQATADAIQAKTDALPTDPADQSLIIAATDQIRTDIAGVQADTDNIQTRLPAALVGGRMDASLGAINGNTGGAAALDRAARTIVEGTVGAGATTTSIPTSSLTPAVTVADQLKGRVILFAEDTATAALRGQASEITANTNTGTLTVVALTTAPASGDSFVVV